MNSPLRPLTLFQNEAPLDEIRQLVVRTYLKKDTYKGSKASMDFLGENVEVTVPSWKDLEDLWKDEWGNMCEDFVYQDNRFPTTPVKHVHHDELRPYMRFIGTEWFTRDFAKDLDEMLFRIDWMDEYIMNLFEWSADNGDNTRAVMLSD